MKAVKGFIVITLVAAGVLLAARYLNCGYLRNYTPDSDKTIREIREKIAPLEKNGIKDTKALFTLANQYSRLGTIYIEKRLWGLAIENYEKAIGYGKDTPGVYYSLGLAYANRGSEKNDAADIDRAEANYQKAIAMQDDYYDARNALAILLFYHKDEKDRAIELMEGVVARNKKHYIARFTLGRFYYETGKLSRALSIYEDLSSDLDKLPPSRIIGEYRNNARDNIQRILTEMKKQKGD